MASVSLGNFEPDKGGLDSALLVVAKNAFPSPLGWAPMPSLSVSSSDALPSTCLGLFFAKTSAGAFQVYAGTATKLYKLVSGVWTDYTRVAGGDYSVSTGAQWRAAQWGSLLIVVNSFDEPQVLDVDGGGANFSDLLGNPPIASDISIVSDFVFLVDATNKRRLIYCGTNGPNFDGDPLAVPPTFDSWEVGKDFCDEYVPPDGGDITSAPGLGEYGVFLQSGGMARRVVLQPGDQYSAFRFEKLEGVKGSVTVNAVCSTAGRMFYLSEDGFYTVTADGANTPIGSQRVNAWFSANSDQARLEQVTAFTDPYSMRVYFAAYASASSTAYDLLVGYDYQLDRWFYSDGAVAVAYAAVAVPSITLEDLDVPYPGNLTPPYGGLDTADWTTSLDARQYQGGRITLGAVTTTGMLAFLTGSPLEAEFKTAGGSLVGGKRAILRWIEPKGEYGAATVTAAVGKREYDGATRMETAFESRSSRTGRIQVNASARVHDFRVKIAAGGDWTFAQSLETVEQPDGDQ